MIAAYLPFFHFLVIATYPNMMLFPRDQTRFIFCCIILTNE